MVGEDKRTDLAVLKVETKDALPCVVLADSDLIYPGDKVRALGHPERNFYSLTEGIV